MIYKCKMCGGNVELSEDRTFGICMFCGSAMTFPKLDDEQRANMFNRGNHFRRIGDFDSAVAVYEQLIMEDNTDAEAHWCCAISRFGIEYVEDPETYDWVPTCHRLSFDPFTKDVDYLAALEYSEGVTRKQYMRDAAKIRDVQNGILKTSQNEEPFDVFICYKETADNGERTEDSVLAQEVYKELTDRGYRVFFSRITLEDKVGTEFEPYIFAALNSAKVMIVIGTKREYLNAVWVRNEWSRYLAMIRKDHEKVLLPCYKDMDPYDMPEALAALQAYDMNKTGFVQDLIRGVSKIVDNASLNANGVAYHASTVEPLLKRARMFIEDGDLTKADEFCEVVLNLDPENARAYLYKAMVKARVSSEEELISQGWKLKYDPNIIKALRFAKDNDKTEIEEIVSKSRSFDNEKMYLKACDEAGATRDLRKMCEAYLLFVELKGYKDSDTRKEKLKSEYLDQQFELVYSRMEAADHYSELKPLVPACKVLIPIYPVLRKCMDKFKAMCATWEGSLEAILQNESKYQLTKEIYDAMKNDCPVVFDSERHKEFVKELEILVYIEKLYGNTKDSTIKLIKNYLSGKPIK